MLVGTTSYNLAEFDESVVSSVQWTPSIGSSFGTLIMNAVQSSKLWFGLFAGVDDVTWS